VSTSLRADFTLGFLGAGQLARMSAIQAFRFGIQVAVYSDRRENEPVQFMTPQTGNGSFSDIDAMVSFANRCDLITLENEFIDSRVLQKVQEQSNTPIYPAPESFALIENKLIEKQTFEKAGIPVTPYALVDSEASLQEFGDKYGWPFLLKSSKGGYDGYGNEKVNTPDEALKALQQLGGKAGHDILAEAFVDFSHELAVQVARNNTGTAVYPCCETIQQNHICIAVRTPAPISAEMQKKAEELAVAAT
jgi:5-(carboxyamino)imidazole ribonucleotide synthase